VIVISLDYIAAGKNLRLRFRRATTEQAGKDEFRFDGSIMEEIPQLAAAFLLHLNLWMQRRQVPAFAPSALRTTRSMKRKLQNEA
jgi:hypothetical protein